MAEAGCDLVLAHVGLTAGGTIGAQGTLSLQEAAALIARIRDAALARKPDALVLCHGGPISTPADMKALLTLVRVDGFVGASSMERLPVEVAIRDATAAFAAIELP